METEKVDIRDVFRNNGLKATPQRVAVYDALNKLGHACVDEIVAQVHVMYPTVTVGTIYNVLDCFLQRKLISRVNTSDNKMYFDISTHDHHHLYCPDNNRIEDYMDDGLADLINNYFRDRSIAGFSLSDIKIQLMGTFMDKK